MRFLKLLLIFFIFLPLACTQYDYDVVIENGTVYDGTGSEGVATSIAIKNDRIVHIGEIDPELSIRKTIDATGMAVTPGFINMLSWANNSLITDGRSMSDIKQGVTLEIFGEGSSMGPLNPEAAERRKEINKERGIRESWTTLGEYLEFLEKRGVATNVASFVGAATVRRFVLGDENVVPDSAQLDEMRELVRIAMQEGAMGLGTSLIYTPGLFASTDELIELSKIVAQYDGLYISHIRSEGDRFEEAIQELITIASEANVRAEIHHLKAAGKENWDKLDNVIQMIEAARADSLHITTNMYTYPAAATSFTAIMPAWIQEGGQEAWIERLQDPELRARVVQEIVTPSDEFENFYLMAGTPDGIIPVGFENPELQHLTGKSLATISDERGTDPIETAIDLIIEDNSSVGVVYFLMSEENVRRQVALPWMSFGSDSGSIANEGDFLNQNPHPRAYGNFARLLGKYVRDEQVISLAEAIHKITGLPATNLKLKDRGLLKVGYFADIVIFDPETIQDHATFENPHQYATGVRDVFVNGTQVLKNGEHTNKMPGRFVRGPGYYIATAMP
ncbi:MAG TPA: aminoacylase [Bacteroidetes bacterium]|nr:aminoacylase [Bacteroidota bacterium]